MLNSGVTSDEDLCVEKYTRWVKSDWGQMAQSDIFISFGSRSYIILYKESSYWLGCLGAGQSGAVFFVLLQ